MLHIVGRVMNLYTNEGGKNKDGSEYDARSKVQLLGEADLPNGDVKNDLIDLTVDDLKDWVGLKGKEVSVDIGAFAPQKGKIIYFIKKGTKPQVVGATHA